MKPQDILFFIFLLFLIWRNRPQWSGISGLLCIVLAMPLFYKQIFYTAQHLTWYAAGFFLLAILQNLFILRRNK